MTVHPAIRAPDAFDRAVYRVDLAQENHDRHGELYSRTYKASLKAVDRYAKAATDALPSLIDSVAGRLSERLVDNARQIDGKARAGGSVVDTIALIRVPETA